MNKNKNQQDMKQTAVEYIIEQLYAPCRGIPSHIIEKAKEMEKEQLKNVWLDGRNSRINGQDPMDQIKYL
jgi:hypothetical protein